MALTLSIVDQDLKEAAGLLGGLDSLKWDGETDWSKLIDEGIEQLEDDLVQMGVDPDDIDATDTSLKSAATWKALELVFFGLMRREGDQWDIRRARCAANYKAKLKRAIITLEDESEVRVSQTRVTR